MTYELLAVDVEKLHRILVSLMEQSEADSCLICDQAGHVLAHENLKQTDPLLISALGAGVFAATRELARLLGEDEFSTVLHQGLKRSILIGSANEEVLLVVLFSGEERTGLVKLYAPASAKAVRRVFEEITARGKNGPESKDRNYVLKDIGSIFGNGR
ncbi:MAG: roadblock/LC7 domain-containing protein [Lentisphaeria bacterium]|jgi:predicted regulator of Ras-like GTPase activity (Roadblock/LC7/MglB family)|nr:roadblock/LC7 domain-containing protein [Lentisphaeria bacterium]